MAELFKGAVPVVGSGLVRLPRDPDSSWRDSTYLVVTAGDRPARWVRVDDILQYEVPEGTRPKPGNSVPVHLERDLVLHFSTVPGGHLAMAVQGLIGSNESIDLTIDDGSSGGGPGGGQGAQGDPGPKGDPGSPGAPGQKGEQGDAGAPGQKGDPGSDGNPGPKGDRGEDGPQGSFYVEIHLSATTAPTSAPAGGSFDIGSGTLTAPAGWSTSYTTPTTGQTAYVSRALIDPGTQSGTVTPTWSVPHEAGARGATGPAGAPGQKGEQGDAGAPGQKGEQGQGAASEPGGHAVTHGGTTAFSPITALSQISSNGIWYVVAGTGTTGDLAGRENELVRRSGASPTFAYEYKDAEENTVYDLTSPSVDADDDQPVTERLMFRDGEWRPTSEGLDNTSSGAVAHAEGRGNTASGEASHAEGLRNTASGVASHAAGRDNEARGDASYAGGDDARAVGNDSFAHGEQVTAIPFDSFILGKNGVVGLNTTLFGIANGAVLPDETSRSTAEDLNLVFKIDDEGRVFADDVIIGDVDEGAGLSVLKFGDPANDLGGVNLLDVRGPGTSATTEYGLSDFVDADTYNTGPTTGDVMFNSNTVASATEFKIALHPYHVAIFDALVNSNTVGTGIDLISVVGPSRIWCGDLVSVTADGDERTVVVTPNSANPELSSATDFTVRVLIHGHWEVEVNDLIRKKFTEALQAKLERYPENPRVAGGFRTQRYETIDTRYQFRTTSGAYSNPALGEIAMTNPDANDIRSIRIHLHQEDAEGFLNFMQAAAAAGCEIDIPTQADPAVFATRARLISGSVSRRSGNIFQMRATQSSSNTVADNAFVRFSVQSIIERLIETGGVDLSSITDKLDLYPNNPQRLGARRTEDYRLFSADYFLVDYDQTAFDGNNLTAGQIMVGPDSSGERTVKIHFQDEDYDTSGVQDGANVLNEADDVGSEVTITSAFNTASTVSGRLVANSVGQASVGTSIYEFDLTDISLTAINDANFSTGRRVRVEIQSVVDRRLEALESAPAGAPDPKTLVAALQWNVDPANLSGRAVADFERTFRFEFENPRFDLSAYYFEPWIGGQMVHARQQWTAALTHYDAVVDNTEATAIAGALSSGDDHFDAEIRFYEDSTATDVLAVTTRRLLIIGATGGGRTQTEVDAQIDAKLPPFADVKLDPPSMAGAAFPESFYVKMDERLTAREIDGLSLDVGGLDGTLHSTTPVSGFSTESAGLARFDFDGSQREQLDNNHGGSIEVRVALTFSFTTGDDYAYSLVLPVNNPSAPAASSELADHEADPSAHQDSPRRQATLGIDAPVGRRVYLTAAATHPQTEHIYSVALGDLGPQNAQSQDRFVGASVLDFSAAPVNGPEATSDTSGLPAIMDAQRVAGIWQDDLARDDEITLAVAAAGALSSVAPTHLHISGFQDIRAPLTQVGNNATVGGTAYRIMRTTSGGLVGQLAALVGNSAPLAFSLQYATGYLDDDGTIDTGIDHAVGEYVSLGGGRWKATAGRVVQAAVDGADGAGVNSITLPANYADWRALSVAMWTDADDDIAPETIPTALIAAQSTGRAFLLGRRGSTRLAWNSTALTLTRSGSNNSIVYAELHD